MKHRNVVLAYGKRFAAPVAAFGSLGLSSLALADGTDLATGVTTAVTAQGSTVTTIGVAVLGVIVLLMAIKWAASAVKR